MPVTVAIGSILRCLYTARRPQYHTIDISKAANVTDTLTTILQGPRAYCEVSNENFGDPCPGMVKVLLIYQRRTPFGAGILSHVVEEGDKVYADTAATRTINYSAINYSAISNNTALANYHFIIYYHIYCNANTLPIFEEQLATIVNNPLFSSMLAVNCCVTGNNMTVYQAVVKRLTDLQTQTNGKIRLRKAVFGDTSYEKFTFYAIKEDVLGQHPMADGHVLREHPVTDGQWDNTFITYLHTKGVSTPPNSLVAVAAWRHCMEYFVITRSDWTIARMLREGADSASCFYRDFRYAPKHYSGGIWMARASYLRRLFSAFPNLGNDNSGRPVTYKRNVLTSDYYATEFYLFKLAHPYLVLYDTKLNLYKSPVPAAAYHF